MNFIYDQIASKKPNVSSIVSQLKLHSSLILQIAHL